MVERYWACVVLHGTRLLLRHIQRTWDIMWNQDMSKKFRGVPSRKDTTILDLLRAVSVLESLVV
jgi:hypothetical protein